MLVPRPPWEWAHTIGPCCRQSNQKLVCFQKIPVRLILLQPINFRARQVQTAACSRRWPQRVNNISITHTCLFKKKKKKSENEPVLICALHSRWLNWLETLPIICRSFIPCSLSHQEQFETITTTTSVFTLVSPTCCVCNRKHPKYHPIFFLPA